MKKRAMLKGVGRGIAVPTNSPINTELELCRL